MTKSQHRSGEPQRAANQSNQMSSDPKDGDRNSFVLGKDGTTPVEKAPEQDAQDQEQIEEFGQQGGDGERGNV